MVNRSYQDAAHAAIRDYYLKGVNRQLLSMATGTGKTVVFSQLPNRMKDVLPGQTLILAHREELIDQAIDKMRIINPGLKIDKEKAEHRADPSTADVIVGSVATLGRKGTKRLDNYNWERIDKYVTDEAHHSIATSYMNIYEAAGLLQEGDKRLLLGVTATPQRGDGKALAKLYQKISFSYGMRQAIEEGWLVDVKGVRVSTDTSLDEVRTVGGDFAQDMLADTVNTPARNQLIVKAWMEKGEGRQTIGFTVDIQHAHDLAAMFVHYGIKAAAVWGDDLARALKLQQHKDKELTALFNCGVLVEGYDDWRIGCAILARPTKSSVLFTQMVGRTTRLEEGLGNLFSPDYQAAGTKFDCLVLDVVDASTQHSLVTLPTLMGMSGKLDLKGKSLVKSIQQLEAKQKEYPNIDFSQLRDITKLSALITEQVNMFDVKFPPEVETGSQLSWHTAADGGFVLLLPGNKERVTIKQNLLDKWEVRAIINNVSYKGERDTLDETFLAADNLITSKLPDALTLLKREQPWHNDPPTTNQLWRLNKIFKGRPLPPNLTKGHASKLIGQHFAGTA